MCLCLVVDSRMLMLLEEIKQQNQTQSVLLQQLLSQHSAPAPAECNNGFDLPVRSVEQLLKLESSEGRIGSLGICC